MYVMDIFHANAMIVTPTINHQEYRLVLLRIVPLETACKWRTAIIDVHSMNNESISRIE